MFDLIVYIGRFQIFHNGHDQVVKKALDMSKQVLMLIGSAGSGRTLRNPFTYEERKEMIEAVYEEEVIAGKLVIDPLFDKMYRDSAWLAQVQALVKRHAQSIGAKSVAIIGADKDHSTQYMGWFPQWKTINLPVETQINATKLREFFFSGDSIGGLVPPTVGFDLAWWYENGEFMEALKAERSCAQAYALSWSYAPYPVKQVTVDAVVEQSGHILLVKRKDYPGKGKWALPGGHLNIDESLLTGAIRELREETGLKVPDPVLRGSIRHQHTFDDPHRSSIGRVITTAFHFKLRDMLEGLPHVKGSDDAEKAQWIPISEIVEADMFDDHYHIIQYFIGG